MEAIDQQLITGFLLGELSEDDRQNVEEHFFRDDRFYEQVLAVQEELADDYVQHKLSSPQRTHFEEYFLQTPRRRARLEFAAAFSGALARSNEVATAPAPTFRWASFLTFVRPRLALATSLATLLIFLLGGSWLYLHNRRLSAAATLALRERDATIQQTQVREAEAARRRQELQDEIAALRAQGGELQSKIQQKERELDSLQRARRATPVQAAPGFAAAFTLQPGLTRESNEPEELVIPAAARSIQLRLGLEREEQYQDYLAEIRTARGHLVWSKSGLVSQRTSAGQSVLLTLPNKYLANGEYEVALKGGAPGKLEAVGYYYFIALNR